MSLIRDALEGFLEGALTAWAREQDRALQQYQAGDRVWIVCGARPLFFRRASTVTQVVDVPAAGVFYRCEGRDGLFASQQLRRRK